MVVTLMLGLLASGSLEMRRDAELLSLDIDSQSQRLSTVRRLA
tara:strand:+ start:5813 stop:5941 length:129 start_codon:yes stop_codon:yes gene_type:complete